MGNGAANVANLLTRASANAGTVAHDNQQTGQQGSVMDVWSHSYDGMARRVGDFAADPVGSATGPTVEEQRAMLSAMADVSSVSADQWIDSSMAQQEALSGQVVAIGRAQGALATVGATFALLTSIEQMISTMLSVIPFPAIPALRILDFDVGLPHAHNHPPNLTPPNPVPVPLPSTGPVIPIPILSGASRTLINGMPAARCGDMGLGVWCGGYFPMYEVFLGSSNVWIEGSRASRLAVDITKHCIFTTPKPSDPPIGPMIGFTINSSTNVLIGGVPMPSLLSLALGGAFKGLFRGLGRLVSWVRNARNASRFSRAMSAPGDTVVENISRLRGRPSGFFPPTPTGRAFNFLRNLPRNGSRIEIPDGINAGELAALTRATGDEFAVVWSTRYRELNLIRGTSDSVRAGADDIVLVHTHPRPNSGYASDVSMGDVHGAAASANRHGFDHGEAVIAGDGTVHHFNGRGVVENPTLSPIGQDGNISGLYTSPTGAPMSAVPPGMI